MSNENSVVMIEDAGMSREFAAELAGYAAAGVLDTTAGDVGNDFDPIAPQ